MRTSAGAEVTHPGAPHADEVLTPDALDFVAQLHRSFNPERKRLLADRRRRPDPEPRHDRRERINASPAGGTLPILLAAGAEMVLGSPGEGTVAADDFWTGYRTTARRDDELLLRIRVPTQLERQVRFCKVGTRRAQAISKVVMALAWHGESDKPRTDVRLALGSMAATTVRAPRTEKILEGSEATREAADLATQALTCEIQPIDVARSTADYRRAVAGRVLHRLINDEGRW